MNLQTRTTPTGESVSSDPPPSPAELEEKFPQFEILECLGRGGMGIVYRARQKALDRIVAIKILAGEWQDEAGFAQRFEKEAKLLAKLNHPNIVTIHDFGNAGGLYHIVMEYVDGVNVRDLLRDGKLESEQALAIVPPICDALQFAHDHGVVHRDIKPENILLDREGRVKIADFGIASIAGDAADRSGTPAYMAPEQSRQAEAVDHRADIYALGVVLHEMLTGERPAADPVAPSRRVEIDVRLDEIVLRSLAAKPEQRFQQVSEVKGLVTKVMSTPRPEAKPEPAMAAEPEPERVKVRVRVVPWRVFAQAGAAALLAGGVFRLWNQTYLYAADVPDFVKAGSYLSRGIVAMACFTVLAWLGFRRHAGAHGGDDRPWRQRKVASAAGMCMALGILIMGLSFPLLPPWTPRDAVSGRVVAIVLLVLWTAGLLFGLRAWKSFEGRWALSLFVLMALHSSIWTVVDALRHEWYPPYPAVSTRLHGKSSSSHMRALQGQKMAIDLESGTVITYRWAPVSFERRMSEQGADLYFDGSSWCSVDMAVAEGRQDAQVPPGSEDLDLAEWQLRAGITPFEKQKGTWAFKTRDGVRGVVELGEEPKLVQWRVLDYGRTPAKKDGAVEAETPRELAERLLEKAGREGGAEGPPAAREEAVVEVPLLGAELVRIRITPEGDLTLGRKMITRDELFEELRKIAGVKANREVRIEAGSETAYRRVNELVGLCMRAGLSNLTFYTETTRNEDQDGDGDVPLPKWSDDGAEMILPKEPTAAERGQQMPIRVGADGKPWLGEAEVEPGMLLEKLRRFVALNPAGSVRIDMDPAVNYSEVVKVIDLCQQAGIWNVSFSGKAPDAAYEAPDEPSESQVKKWEAMLKSHTWLRLVDGQLQSAIPDEFLGEDYKVVILADDDVTVVSGKLVKTDRLTAELADLRRRYPRLGALVRGVSDKAVQSALRACVEARLRSGEGPGPHGGLHGGEGMGPLPDQETIDVIRSSLRQAGQDRETLVAVGRAENGEEIRVLKRRIEFLSKVLGIQASLTKPDGVIPLPGVEPDPASAATLSAPPDRGLQPLQIRILADDSLSLDGRTMSLDELQVELRKAAAADPDLKVTLSADETVRHQQVVEVMNACKQASIGNLFFQKARDRLQEVELTTALKSYEELQTRLREARLQQALADDEETLRQAERLVTVLEQSVQEARAAIEMMERREEIAPEQ